MMIDLIYSFIVWLCLPVILALGFVVFVHLKLSKEQLEQLAVKSMHYICWLIHYRCDLDIVLHFLEMPPHKRYFYPTIIPTLTTLCIVLYQYIVQEPPKTYLTTILLTTYAVACSTMIMFAIIVCVYLYLTFERFDSFEESSSSIRFSYSTNIAKHVDFYNK